MNRTLRSLPLFIAIASSLACIEHHHEHPSETAEHPTIAVTRWSASSELFMEYPLLVAGRSGRSAVHLTNLSDFSPLRDGEAIVVLRAADGQVLEFRGGASRPGIFGVDLTPDKAGVYEMSLRVESPQLQDLHTIGPVTVYAPSDTLPAVTEAEGEEISYLKEQQWVLEFGTSVAQTRALQASLTVPATIVARPGADATIEAPVAGRIDPSSSIPTPGSRVRKGSVLAKLVPHSEDVHDEAVLRSDLVAAEQDHALAQREHERVERLVEAQALPARRLDEARAAALAAASRLDAARSRVARYESLSQSRSSEASQGLFTVRAPFDGIVAEVGYTPGASVERAAFLARLIDPDRVQIVGRVPETNAAALRHVAGGELLTEDKAPIMLARPLAVGRVIDPVSRSADVRFAFDNTALQLPIGQQVQLRLFTGQSLSVTAVRESAIVDDGGRAVVFVQSGGESFERREVQLGIRSEGWVQILAGVAPQERVVDRGAYLVRLAALSTQVPSHGHVH